MLAKNVAMEASGHDCDKGELDDRMVQCTQTGYPNISTETAM